jgi:hypothetical protein
LGASAVGSRFPSLEGPIDDLPCLYNRVLMSVSMASIENKLANRFKIVCEDCGSLSIKVADPAYSPAATLVQCGRCNAVRRTVGDLHDLARRGTDLFEF